MEQNRNSSDENLSSEDTTNVPEETQEQKPNESSAPISVEDAHTLEELRNSIDTGEIEQTTDDPFVGIPSAMNKPQTKHSKQSRHQKNSKNGAKGSRKRRSAPYTAIFTGSACRTSCT